LPQTQPMIILSAINPMTARIKYVFLINSIDF
jgi:hypothetical protein